MEVAFGRSFGDVRVHRDPGAARISRSISAEAFTVGSDIFFGSGRFDPTTEDGQQVLAHELGHVVAGADGVRRKGGKKNKNKNKKKTNNKPKAKQQKQAQQPKKQQKQTAKAAAPQKPAEVEPDEVETEEVETEETVPVEAAPAQAAPVQVAPAPAAPAQVAPAPAAPAQVAPVPAAPVQAAPKPAAGGVWGNKAAVAKLFEAPAQAAPAAVAQVQAAPQAAAATTVVPGGGLSAHESAGGHTLAKHVGKSDDDLLARLAAEPGINASSTFATAADAESAVATVLAAKQAEITAWLAGAGAKLPLNGNAGSGKGRSVAQGTNDVKDVTGVRVVLVRDHNLPTGYRVQTAFPQP
jgi:hypothetical protein